MVMVTGEYNMNLRKKLQFGQRIMDIQALNFMVQEALLIMSILQFLNNQ
jgi:hypothetical protein